MKMGLDRPCSLILDLHCPIGTYFPSKRNVSVGIPTIEFLPLAKHFLIHFVKITIGDKKKINKLVVKIELNINHSIQKHRVEVTVKMALCCCINMSRCKSLAEIQNSKVVLKLARFS